MPTRKLWPRALQLSQQNHGRRILEFSIFHGAAIMLTWLVVAPLQGFAADDLLSNTQLHAPLSLFFVAIVKALAAWMYRWWAVLYIMPTAFIQHFGWGATVEWSQLAELTLYLTSAPLAICFLEFLGLNLKSSRGLHSLRSLLCVVVISSGILWSCCLFACNPHASWPDISLLTTLFVATDVIGSIAVLFALIAVFRFQERILRNWQVRTEA